LTVDVAFDFVVFVDDTRTIISRLFLQLENVVSTSHKLLHNDLPLLSHNCDLLLSR
jgi:hypothetical protein